MSSNALIFISVAVAVSAVSFFLDKEKTMAGFKRGWQMFKRILLPLLNILIIVSIALFAIPPSAIEEYLGAGSGVGGFFIAAIVGSIAFIPPFISYPIAAGLLQQGASYAVVATLMTTLIMVGIVTLPLEIQYLGRRAAIARNVLNFFAAIIIGLAIGVIL
ncbi:permease [Dehalogenimonas alkenigignens]|uniref:Putative permease n=1 Tax=Dehalogenimonas alkenigignens TaxID=1217799 RepID=A0A0W0GHL2_9CHLR|nr:permease [Dehalogenimonas alkenigignens]KTB48044.1 putative permease [Dehalogenimonas alkenigignens]PVV84298.1 permease [Dehalogenimonas alkenigignens]